VFKKSLLKIVVVFCAALSFLTLASAEFLKTGANVFQSTSKRAKVVVSIEQPGLFIVDGPEIELQNFDPNNINHTSQVKHVFIRYNPELNRYTTILTGSREYRIGGSFTVLVGELRVTLDNSNPYISIVRDSQDQKSAEIIGFMGINVLVNFEGQQAVALLEANQFNEYRNVLSPYTVKEDGLYVKNMPVIAAAVGITPDNKNPCLKNTSLFVSNEEYQKIVDTKNREQSRKLLTEIVDRNKKSSPLVGLLKLKTTNTSLIVLDPIKAEVKVIKKGDQLSENTTLCIVEVVIF
jgi:hypothetical protein